MSALRVAVVTCSDSRAAEEAADTAGAALVALSEQRGWTVVSHGVVPDDVEAVSRAIVDAADRTGADIVLTTGGTGLGPRDVTPEATLAVCDREVPGVAEAIRVRSLEVTGRAMLSRGVAGQRGKALVVNLPGSEKGAREAFGFVAGQLEHAADMMAGGGHG